MPSGRLDAAYSFHLTFSFYLWNVLRQFHRIVDLVPLLAKPRTKPDSIWTSFIAPVLFCPDDMSTIGLNVYSTTNNTTTTQTDNQDTPYGYTPTLYICILFIVLYGVTTTLHALQSCWSRLWWLFPTAVLAGIAELIGWSGRLWSSINPHAADPFLIQIVTTIIAPTPFIAANFVILGHLIKRLGPQYSRLSARWYTLIFCSCDLVALVIQAVGGAQAAAADDHQSSATGGHIMLGGIVFQLVAICVYALLAVEFLLRFHHDRPFRRGVHVFPRSADALDRGTKAMISALCMIWIFLFIRSIYRTIELSDGWNGRIITTERYFNVLDGAMIVLAMFTLNFFHPGLLLGKAAQWKRIEASRAGSLEALEKQANESTASSL
ncbi:RTA1-domain-containing protein [Trametes coccinea BRFM310]|uniref:RTA1-domain-containing protein n=1 Tax=Trametes coccinea (strain BRFM310) TaxID=1353009 RepID=A0A1Y2J2Y7_TRAC3|nr:RTA1-domain-containing protein [Trametes coccinea BRFM310]